MFSIGDVNGNGPPAGSQQGITPGMSESTSTPTVVSTPENSILDRLSGVASGLAQQMVGWAQGVFAQTSAVTNQAVNNFFQTSQKMNGLSDNLTGQYNNLFAPENAQLVADANSYASPARMAVDMGQAGATQAQAGDQALHNSEEALKSYGIDPSSGRYAALDKAAAVQNSANVAGAMNTQRNTDIATGQRLRSEAVQVGAQLPSAIANVNNTALAANTGAANASTANANTGANLMNVGNNYLKTAMGIPLSPVAQTSQSQSFNPRPITTIGGGGNPFPDDTGGGGGGGSSNPYPNGPISDSGPAWGMDMPTADSAQYDSSYAEGGIVHDFRGGGPVPMGMSPSQGQQTDDVHANVNAGEFVVPKDVVAHKGSEFFQNLVAKSRKANMIHQAGQQQMGAR